VRIEPTEKIIILLFFHRRLTARAKNHLMKSEKFENISDELPRTEQLIEQYDDLYSQLRLEAMDDLDNIESLNCLEKSDEIKSQISFAIMTVRYCEFITFYYITDCSDCYHIQLRHLENM
jgi:hypothetical protein